MKINKDLLRTLRIAFIALTTVLIARNCHWSITLGFVYLLFTQEIQGKLLLDILSDTIKLIGKTTKLEDINLDKEKNEDKNK